MYVCLDISYVFASLVQDASCNSWDRRPEEDEEVDQFNVRNVQ